MKKDCTTCAWGVEWLRVFSGEGLTGYCLWECPVPHPPSWGRFVRFSEKSEPVKDCPAWKRERDSRKLKFRQQWKEEPAAFQRRLYAESDRLKAEYEAKYGGLK